MPVFAVSCFDVHLTFSRGSYNATIWGPSGNITINGTLTFGNSSSPPPALAKRGLGEAAEPGVNLNSPPYALHNGSLPHPADQRFFGLI